MRLFVAAWPDEAIRRIIGELDVGGLERGPVPPVRMTRPDEWHVTLSFLGRDVDEALIPAVDDALERAAGSARGPVRVVVGPAIAWFPGQHVLYLPVAGLEALAERVRAETAPVVHRRRDEPEFIGHITLARVLARGLVRAAGGDPASPDPAAAPPDPAGLPLEAAFTVDHIDLVASTLSPGGPRYTVLRRIPLPAREAAHS
jgi:2'-5' RNA ligase